MFHNDAPYKHIMFGCPSECMLIIVVCVSELDKIIHEILVCGNLLYLSIYQVKLAKDTEHIGLHDEIRKKVLVMYFKVVWGTSML